MQRNIGTRDRIFRLILFLALLFVSLFFKNALLFFGALFVLYEAVAGWCALYALLGKSSCPIANKKNTSPLQFYWKGLLILVGAIILNGIGSYIGLSTWYEVFSGTASWDIFSIVFLFIVYPLFLGIFANLTL